MTRDRAASLVTGSELVETALRLGLRTLMRWRPESWLSRYPRREVRLGTRGPPSRFRRKAARDLKGYREPRECEGQAPETIALVHEPPEVAACADIALPRELDRRRVVELRVLRGSWWELAGAVSAAMPCSFSASTR
jgi:hypothetical protein